MRRIFNRFVRAGALLTGLAFSLTGCQQQPDKVLDVKAPGFQLEVERSPDGSHSGIKIDAGTDESGANIDIQRNDTGTTVDVEPPSAK